MGFLKTLVKQYKKRYPGTSEIDIYSEMPDMNRQNFFAYLNPKRAVSPYSWKEWRKALKMSRRSFWDAAMSFYDPED